ncbi:PAS domain-containing protein [Aliidongia dinghuensis]|uniref:PAS domain-containing protein n=1 Tax=Aliidongia dinghuensis TaxID=1867774 RepID=UPI00166BDCEC|nr:PAS domain-containing protein [Aliidongia dinghuensis]
MLDYWEAKRPAGRLPARADVDPVDLREVLGWLSLIEVRPSEPRFFIRLLGSSHQPRPFGPRHGHDFAAMQPAAYRELVVEQYEMTVARRAPVLHENTLSFGVHRLSYQRVALPLAKDHETPDMLMVASRLDPIQHTRFFSAYNLAAGLST